VEQEAWLEDFVVFLVAASLVVPLFHRARIGAIEQTREGELGRLRAASEQQLEAASLGR
jgi:hypothetical protein